MLMTCLISSTSSFTLTAFSLFPPRPKPHNSNQKLNRYQQNQQSPPVQIPVKISRREAALLSSLSFLLSFSPPDPAIAFSFGFSGPKDWLKEQKKKASRFLLAPIDASRESLRSAYLLLARESGYTDKDAEEVRRYLKSAARDCVSQDRNSLVAFQASTGVEVCTFKLIVKNASSLLDDRDPIKLEAEVILTDLIRSFTSLSAVASENDIRLSSNRQKVADALIDTISSLGKFEKSIKDCLEI
ncbi:uncharacterized protein LOC110816660 [Carica papaya]|uniref:uncharacterized protein LOC110816660 n=1 Tax=Carica papaya TaxID=3649 RepID=UPI000B8C8FE6|nr:uncharacterized protein LOC110816660 [Carica papaya]